MPKGCYRKRRFRRSQLNGGFCEGFRMPALHRGLPSGRDGAGVRKPPRKETASRKGAYPPRALWGFESRQRLLASGRNAIKDDAGPSQRLAVGPRRGRRSKTSKEGNRESEGRLSAARAMGI